MLAKMSLSYRGLTLLRYLFTLAINVIHLLIVNVFMLSLFFIDVQFQMRPSLNGLRKFVAFPVVLA